MKNLFIMLIPILFIQATQRSPLTGSWQLVKENACMNLDTTSLGPSSDTEKELLGAMQSSSQTSVARVIKFTNKGTGEDGVFTKGNRKSTDRNKFTYRLSGDQLFLTDSKSGIILQTLIIDVLTDTDLQFHDASRTCEIKAFTRIRQ